MPLIGYVFKPLAKSVLISPGLTGAASAADTAIVWTWYHNINNFDREMNDIMKIFKSIEESILLIK